MPSKRTIASAQINAFATVMAGTNSYDDAGERLIMEFGTGGHPIFTRKDWDLVLEAHAAIASYEIPDVKTCNLVFARVTKGLDRPKWGHYLSPTAPKSSVKAPETAPAAEPEPAPAPSTPDTSDAAQATLDAFTGASEPDELMDLLETELKALGEKDEALRQAAEETAAEFLSISSNLDSQAVAVLAEPEEEPEPETEAGVAWTPETPEASSHPIYVEDEGLRRLAVSQTRCFGSYSDRAPTCKGCPLAGFCAVASMTGLADIEAALNRETEEALQRAKDEEERQNLFNDVEPEPMPEPVDPDLFDIDESGPATPSETPTVSKPLPDGATRLRPPFESFCAVCNGKVAANTDAVHVPGRGLLHEACV